MPSIWAIGLAAGAGRRLASVTNGVPKQFWRPDGGHSLIEETLVRLEELAVPDRVLTVVDRSHRRYVQALPQQWRLGHVVYQPMDRGTAAGVILPLAMVLAADPQAIVVVTPADHGVGDDARFRLGIEDAIGAIDAGGAEIVLFGVEPTEAARDYGWITAATPLASFRRLRSVVAFVEKPPIRDARKLLRAGSVWNTMVLVAKATALFEGYVRHLPELAKVFSAFRSVRLSEREAFLASIYADLPVADFSGDLLTHVAGLSLYTWPHEMGWLDLGTPERLSRWLASATPQTPVRTAALTA
jgi:mannose-1-phosphate guanylyltransferase